MPKIHISLDVADVSRSVTFYRSFFGVEPVKLKSDYAKFDLQEPSVNFTLNQRPSSAGGSLNHLGIQVENTDLVLAAKQRLEASGLLTVDEMNTNCCYAIQDKIWVQDPDGHQWEIFHVIQGDVAPAESQDATCCGPGMACATSETPMVSLEVL